MEAVKDSGSRGAPLFAAPPVGGRQLLAMVSPAGWTAPSPAARPTPLSLPAVLDQLVDSLAETRGAVLASVDGFPLAKSATMPAEPAHSAMLAAAIGLARQLVGMAGGTNLRQVVVDHDGGLLLVWPIGSQRVLAVVAETTVDQRLLRRVVQANVRVLAERPAGTR
ncbi:MAG: roadblock/LC7 domain-containing protein [Ilumatobacteraceae bacterium]